MTAGLILAAGEGRRFGDAPKQLADLGGRPLLQWAIDAVCGVDPRVLDPVVLVLGARADAVRAGVDPRRARVVVCDAWRDGQSASLRRGLDALGPADEPVLVTLADVPLLTTEVIAHFAREPAPVRATYRGRPGHPVLLGGCELQALVDARGDRGARSLLADVRTIECAERCRGDDVDTPEDLRAVKAWLARQADGSRPDAGGPDATSA